MRGKPSATNGIAKNGPANENWGGMACRPKIVFWSLVATVLLASIAAVVVSSGLWSAPPYPVYNGQPLSYWLPRMDREPHEAEAAIRGMGREAVPFLITELRARDSWLAIRFRRLMRHQKLIKWSYVPAQTRQDRAMRACLILKADAQDAAPALEALLDQPPLNPNLLFALGRSGVPGTLAVVRALRHSSREVRSEAAGILQILYALPEGLNAEPVLTILTNQLRHPLPERRMDAIEAIGWMRQRPALCLPAIAEKLRDPDVEVRRCAAATLGRFIYNTNAEPFIRKAFLDFDPVVRRNATNALKALYPPPRPNYE